MKTYTTKQFLADLWQARTPYKDLFWKGTCIRLFGDAIWLVPPWLLGEIINFATKYQLGDSIQYFWQMMGILIVISIVHFLCHDICKYYIYQLAERVNIDAQLKTLTHIMKIDFLWHQGENTGNKIKRIAKGGAGYNMIFRMYVNLFIESVVNIIAISFIVAQLSWGMFGILLFFFATYFYIALQLIQRTKKQTRIVNIDWEIFNGVSFELLHNIMTVKSLGIFAPLFHKVQVVTHGLVEKIRKRILLYRQRTIILNIYQEIFLLIIIAFTTLKVFQGEFEVGVIAMMMFYFFKISESADELARVTQNLVISKIDIERMQALLDVKPHVEVIGTETFTLQWKHIKIQSLNFSYEKRQVFNEFDLHIKRGEKIGLVGVSGAGKSTLFKLFLKLIDYSSGSIKFDDQELRDIDREDYLKTVSVVLQDTELFNFSLAENVSLESKGDYEKDIDLQTALQVSHVTDFIKRMPQGMHSIVGEKGVRLSGGERQRVGIARAIYRKPDILFLDEATSHLDAQSEAKIQDSLSHVFQDITAIVIAHRLSTLKQMDRILYLHEGKILEQGTFEQLIEQQGAFFDLWQKQNI